MNARRERDQGLIEAEQPTFLLRLLVIFTMLWGKFLDELSS